MKKLVIIAMVAAVLGCAKLSVEATKPIKVDVTMRIDIYQHVEKEASSIEDRIYGKKEKQLNSLLKVIVPEAYAQETPVAAVDEAIAHRKARAPEIEDYSVKGYVGEKLDAFLQVRDGVPDDFKGKVTQAVEAENRDREIIYKATAENNKIAVEGAQQFFYIDHYQRAKAGCWFEVQKKEGKVWKQK
jgi:uncharacterized protein YdbL (DUF1318 family)